MSKKPSRKKLNAYIEVGPMIFHRTAVWLFVGGRGVSLTDGRGSHTFGSVPSARNVARWWGERLGLEVKEKV